MLSNLSVVKAGSADVLADMAGDFEESDVSDDPSSPQLRATNSVADMNSVGTKELCSKLIIDSLSHLPSWILINFQQDNSSLDHNIFVLNIKQQL